MYFIYINIIYIHIFFLQERSLEPNACNGRWIGPREGMSLPGTPLSSASHRSSGDSYSSSGSTRLLLSTNDKTTHA